jgi:hypothetical protein
VGRTEPGRLSIGGFFPRPDKHQDIGICAGRFFFYTYTPIYLYIYMESAAVDEAIRLAVRFCFADFRVGEGHILSSILKNTPIFDSHTTKTTTRGSALT